MAEEEKESTKKGKVKAGRPERGPKESIWSSLSPEKGKSGKAEEKEENEEKGEKEEKSSFVPKTVPATLAETLKDIEEASKRKAERAREIKAKGSEFRTSRLEQAKERLAAGPPVSVLKGSPDALKAAIRRGQIEQNLSARWRESQVEGYGGGLHGAGNEVREDGPL